MPTLVIRAPDGSLAEHALTGELTIGRADGNDLVLDAGGVSRRHARFFVKGKEVSVEDFGSANGTFVDGTKITEPTVVGSDSVVVLGDYEITLKSPKAKSPSGANRVAATKMVPLTAPTGPAAMAKRTKPNQVSNSQLRGLSAPVDGQSFPVAGTMVVGRVAEADLQVDDESVSRKHAEISVSGKEVVLRDLGSANGTTVNGVPIAEDTVLTSGDIIQFGVVELIFEAAASSASRSGPGGAVLARGAPVVPTKRRAGRRGGGDAPQPKKGGSKRLLVVAGAVGVFMLLLVVAKVVSGTRRPPRPMVQGDEPSGLPTADQLDEFLARCRQYSSLENASGPDWSRAEKACNVVVELEPIHKEARELLKKIQLNRKCEEDLKMGKRMVGDNRAEEALDAFAKIRPDCGFFLKALEAAKDPAEDVKKQVGKECKEYASYGKWENAAKRCEVYVRLACQLMDRDERQLPSMMRLKLDGPLGANEWRPKDPLYVNFLKARERVSPNEPPWVCPDFPVLRPPQTAEDPARRAKEDLLRRFSEPEMGRALTLYFDGRFQEMIVPLQKIQENISKAGVHDAARLLLRDLTHASNQYTSGASLVADDKPFEADPFFRTALATDEKLMLGEQVIADPVQKARALDARNSFVRKGVIDSMSKKTFELGRYQAQRNGFLKACEFWKLGLGYSKTNQDLLTAATRVCTKRASDMFKEAETCRDYKELIKYAVDGDNYRQKAEAERQKLSCTD